MAIRNAIIPDRRSEELRYQLSLIYCGELEFDLAAEGVEAMNEESPNRVVAEIEQMHLTGLTRAATKRRGTVWADA